MPLVQKATMTPRQCHPTILYKPVPCYVGRPLHLQQPNAQNIPRAAHNIADGFRDLANEATRMQNMPAFDHGSDHPDASKSVERANSSFKSKSENFETSGFSFSVFGAAVGLTV